MVWLEHIRGVMDTPKSLSRHFVEKKRLTPKTQLLRGTGTLTQQKTINPGEM